MGVICGWTNDAAAQYEGPWDQNEINSLVQNTGILNSVRDNTFQMYGELIDIAGRLEYTVGGEGQWEAAEMLYNIMHGMPTPGEMDDLIQDIDWIRDAMGFNGVTGVVEWQQDTYNLMSDTMVPELQSAGDDLEALLQAFHDYQGILVNEVQAMKWDVEAIQDAAESLDLGLLGNGETVPDRIAQIVSHLSLLQDLLDVNLDIETNTYNLYLQIRALLVTLLPDIEAHLEDIAADTAVLSSIKGDTAALPGISADVENLKTNVGVIADDTGYIREQIFEIKAILEEMELKLTEIHDLLALIQGDVELMQQDVEHLVNYLFPPLAADVNAIREAIAPEGDPAAYEIEPPAKPQLQLYEADGGKGGPPYLIEDHLDDSTVNITPELDWTVPTDQTDNLEAPVWEMNVPLGSGFAETAMGPYLADVQLTVDWVFFQGVRPYLHALVLTVVAAWSGCRVFDELRRYG